MQEYIVRNKTDRKLMVTFRVEAWGCDWEGVLGGF